MPTITSESRITTRMTTETKELLERALVLSGYSSLNSFITNAAVSAAKKLIEQDSVLYLNREEAVNFLNGLDKPREPNPKFLAAVKRRKEKLKNASETIR